jgi:hypothetical protein
VELGRGGIPNNMMALCHGILLKYIHYQSQRFHQEAVEPGCTYETLRRHREFLEPIPINTASIEFRGAQPDVPELRSIPIPKLRLS